jgi:hypothetical protein
VNARCSGSRHVDRRILQTVDDEEMDVIIGVDPHKSSDTATAVTP